MPAVLGVLLLAALALLGPTRARAVDPASATTTVPVDPSGATTTAPVDPTGATTTTAPESRPPQTGPAPEPEHEDTWLDVGHAFIEHRIFAPVLRVDRFFSDERDLEPERARSFFRWRQELRMAERFGVPSYTTSVTANLKLPGLNKQLRRLQIEVVGQTRDVFTTLFPRDRVSAGDTTVPDSNFGTADAGVGFRLFETVAAKIATHGDLGAGVILRLPPGAYGRARLRFAEPLGKKILARQALTGFWRTDTLFGSTASAELERPFARSSLVRLSGSTTVTQRSQGYEWGGDLSVLGALRARIGAQLGFSIAGATQGPVDISSYRFYLRLRRDFYRRWIFLELGPEYAWPWTPLIGRHAVWAVGLRVEVQFQGNEAPPRVPGPDESEPTPSPEPPRSPRGSLPSSPSAG